MGAVYLASQVALERLVAIQLLPAELAQDALFAERPRREAVALARLSHPHIVSIFDFGQTAAGHFYFVIEYVGGYGLQELIYGEPTRLTPAQALSIVDGSVARRFRLDVGSMGAPPVISGASPKTSSATGTLVYRLFSRPRTSYVRRPRRGRLDRRAGRPRSRSGVARRLLIPRTGL